MTPWKLGKMISWNLNCFRPCKLQSVEKTNGRENVGETICPVKFHVSIISGSFHQKEIHKKSGYSKEPRPDFVKDMVPGVNKKQQIWYGGI